MSRKPFVVPALLAAALALPLAARAADADAPTPAPAAAPAPAGEATCSVTPDLGADRAEMLTRLQSKLAEEAARGGGDVVVLNGRGYRYDQRPSIARDLHVLEIELERARAAARAGEPTARP
jgi:hypothetical protein